jgi:hypothetical protein
MSPVTRYFAFSVFAAAAVPLPLARACGEAAF